MEIKELDNVQQAEVRALARAEVASLAGLMMRRLQERIGASDGITSPDVRTALEIWGEVLRDFGETASEPGN